MLHRASVALGITVAMTASLGIALAACSREEPTAVPPAFFPKASTAKPLPTSTPKPSDTPEPTSTPNPATAAALTNLPAGGDEVVVQFGRIENAPWEPEILADMTPNFSLQAKGYIVYRFEGGSSADGWYQTVLTPTLVTDFVRRLVDDVKVIEMARKIPAPEVTFATNPDGTRAGTTAYGVIYVKTADEKARLIVTQEQIENPKGPYAKNLKTLHEIIRALEFWRANSEGTPSDTQKAAVRLTLGWWIDPRAPYTPAEALAFGTRARTWVPPDVPVATWPLDTDLAATFSEAPFGASPVELKLTLEDTAAVLRAGRQQPRTYWGPLWQPARNGGRYLIGVRPAIPGANNVVIEKYRFSVPKRGILPPAASAAGPGEADR